jgi:hypothetical protein
MVTDTLFNKMILILMLFLIGMSLFDCLKGAIPKTIEGLDDNKLSIEATMYKHTGEIAILQEQLGAPLNTLTMKVQELEKKTDSNTTQILDIVKANGANAKANVNDLGI